MTVRRIITPDQSPPLRLVALAVLACLVALALAMLIGRTGQRVKASAALSSKLSLHDALGAQADDARLEHALAPRPFSFPRDHGPHDGFRNEWWYWTGNLSASDGRRFGYQLTIFRAALGPGKVPRESAWASDQAFLAHFTLTEAAANRSPGFHAFERLSRGAVGLAGATGTQGEPFSVWVLDWSAVAMPAARAVDHDAFTLRLRARNEATAIDLRLEQGKAPVLQGNAGLSQKGGRAGNASFYYSLTRMPTRGVLTVDGQDIAVDGLSWMDREWSTSALEAGQVGWDWFSLELDDGRDLMFFRLRRQDGSIDEHSHGSLVDVAGKVTMLAAHDVRIEVLATWTSPISGTTYPARFRLSILHGEAPLTLEISPMRPNQELDLSFRYWEGAVLARGTGAANASGGNRDNPSVDGRDLENRAIAGRGYVELTGYGGDGDDPR